MPQPPGTELTFLLDHVLLLAPGGELVFSGTPATLESHFSSLGYPLPKHESPLIYYGILSFIHKVTFASTSP